LYFQKARRHARDPGRDSRIAGRVEIELNGIVIVMGKSAAQNFVVPIAADDNTWSDVDAA
jgi:hypothetical protein